MNIVILHERDFITSGQVCLKDHRMQHMQRVHRAKPGDRVRVGLLNGQLGDGVVHDLSAESITLQVVLDTPPPVASPITLIMALPRPKMLRRCLRMVAEMGIKELYLINSFRVEKSYWQTPLLAQEQLDEAMILGLEQVRDSRIPQVYLHKRFKPFVEDVLPGLLQKRLGLVAHPYNDNSAIEPLKTRPTEPICLCIGPEGGFIPYEVSKLMEAGCRPFDLGPRIYRVETVLPLIVGALTTQLRLSGCRIA